MQVKEVLLKLEWSGERSVSGSRFCICEAHGRPWNLLRSTAEPGQNPRSAFQNLTFSRF